MLISYLIDKDEKTLKKEVLIKSLSISDFDLDNGDLISNAEILNMYYYNDSLSLEIEDLDSKINEYELKDFNSYLSYADNKLIFQNYLLLVYPYLEIKMV